MSPKVVLILLEIMEKAAQSPGLSHLSGAAHEALKNAALNVIAKDEEDDDDNPRPTHAPSVRRV